MLFAGAHYRQPMAFDDERLAEAGARVARIRDAVRRLADGASPADMRAAPRAFFAALADDFNTAQALGALFEWIREANRRDGARGPRGPRRDARRARAREPRSTPPREAGAEERALLERRQAARAAKDCAAADRLRDELARARLGRSATGRTAPSSSRSAQ